MLKITDGVNVKTVTKGMFDNLYFRMGYRVVEELPIVKKEEPVLISDLDVKKEEKKVPETKSRGASSKK